jgi:hypothetical protein
MNLLEGHAFWAVMNTLKREGMAKKTLQEKKKKANTEVAKQTRNGEPTHAHYEIVINMSPSNIPS